jgi:hypothetical protein
MAETIASIRCNQAIALPGAEVQSGSHNESTFDFGVAGDHGSFQRLRYTKSLSSTIARQPRADVVGPGENAAE